MRLFHRAARPEEETVVDAEPPAPPLPSDPVELGLLLRATRERLGLALETIRDEIDVPVIDLDALERGRLEILHTQQAAVIALWRYAERLGLDASGLVATLRSHWPNRVLAVNAITSRRGFTPVAELRTATQLLSPIADPVSLGTMSIGLSQSTKEMLEARSAKHLFALQLLAPAIALQRSQLGASPMAALPTVKSTETPEAPQLSSGDGEQSNGGEASENGSRLDDRAVLERFMATTAPPEEHLRDDDDEVVVEGLAHSEPTERAPSPSAEAVAPTDGEEVAPVDAELPGTDSGTAAAPPGAGVDAVMVEPAPSHEPLTVAQPVISLPAPSPIAQAVASASAEPPPLVPSFDDLLGRGQSTNRWMRYVSKFVADRLGITPEGVDAEPATGSD